MHVEMLWGVMARRFRVRAGRPHSCCNTVRHNILSLVGLRAPAPPAPRHGCCSNTRGGKPGRAHVVAALRLRQVHALPSPPHPTRCSM